MKLIEVEVHEPGKNGFMRYINPDHIIYIGDRPTRLIEGLATIVLSTGEKFDVKGNVIDILNTLNRPDQDC